MSITATEFDFISRLLKQFSAIVLAPGKEYLVELRLNILSEQLGYDSLHTLIAEVSKNHSPALVHQVVDALTTNETYFFRDLKPFECLKTLLLPELIEKRQQTRELQIWSAACSSGQEPYSIAMVLQEHFAHLLSNWKVSLLASDISSTCLEYAQAASYNQFEVNRGLPVSYLVKYFEQAGQRWQLRPVIKDKVQFKAINLIENWPLPGKMDIIFLNNVLIYFDIPTKIEVLRRASQALKPDGYLFLGGTETALNLEPSLKRLESMFNANVYQIHEAKVRSPL